MTEVERTSAAERPWAGLLSDDDRRLIASTRFGRRIGFGQRAALVVVEAQRFRVAAPDEARPLACGEAGEAALRRLKPLLERTRASSLPVVHVKLELEPGDAAFASAPIRRSLGTSTESCLAGSPGAEFAADAQPEPGDVVIVKRKASAFFATPLLGYLVGQGVDTLIVAGGTTSDAVRATVVDAASYNFHTVVVEDCVFDRFRTTHLTSLFDMDRQYADVIPADEVERTLAAGA